MSLFPDPLGTPLTRETQSSKRRETESRMGDVAHAGTGGKAHEDKASAQRWFDRIDADGNGSISSKEWFDFLNANHGVRDAVIGEQPEGPSVPGFLAESRKQQALGKIMRELDTNGSGTLELEELFAGLRIGKLDHEVRTVPRPPSQAIGRPRSPRMNSSLKEMVEGKPEMVPFAGGLGASRPVSRNMDVLSSSRADQHSTPIAGALASLRPAPRSGNRLKAFTQEADHSGAMKQLGRTRNRAQTDLVDSLEVVPATRTPSRAQNGVHMELEDHHLDAGTPQMSAGFPTRSSNTSSLFSRPAVPKASGSGRLPIDDEAFPDLAMRAHNKHISEATFGFRREDSLRHGRADSIAGVAFRSGTPRTSRRRTNTDISFVSAVLGR